MRRLLLALAAALALTGCAEAPPAAAPPAGPSAEEVQEVLGLLDHHQRLLAAGAEEQRRELTAAQGAFAQSPSEFNRIRLAMVLMLPRTAWHDDARAVALLAALEPAAAAGAPRRQLAQLLQRQAAERLRWQREEARRCGSVRSCEAALREEQKQNETLRRKLDALRDIDRPARPRGAN